ncbi:uncharacterized protein DS421_16g555690 [Arachis hypogaea]|nr:uncharacterized protein DS421_16g555690 [Arachis hypogaea]
MIPAIGKALGAISHFELTPIEKYQAHHHVLVKCDTVVPFVEEKKKQSLRAQTRSQAKIDSVVHAEFPRWFKHEIDRVPMESTLHSKEMKLLACGPVIQARHFGAYNVNRVSVGSVLYYGKIVDIVELNYSCHFTVVLFKCVWVDTTTSRGIKQDHLGLTNVNFSRPIHTGDREEDEPYILASEAQLVYYLDDEVAKEWSIVVHVKPRDLYDMRKENEKTEVGFSPQPGLNMSAEGDIGDLQLTREDDIEDPTENASENIDDVA